MRKILIATLVLCVTPVLLTAAPRVDTDNLSQAIYTAARQARANTCTPNFEQPYFKFGSSGYSLMRAYNDDYEWINLYTPKQITNKNKKITENSSFEVFSNSDPQIVQYTHDLLNYARQRIKRDYQYSKNSVINEVYFNRPDDHNAAIAFNIRSIHEYGTIFSLEIHRVQRTEDSINDYVYHQTLSVSTNDQSDKLWLEANKQWSDFIYKGETKLLIGTMVTLKLPKVITQEYKCYLNASEN